MISLVNSIIPNRMKKRKNKQGSKQTNKRANERTNEQVSRQIYVAVLAITLGKNGTHANNTSTILLQKKRYEHVYAYIYTHRQNLFSNRIFIHIIFLFFTYISIFICASATLTAVGTEILGYGRNAHWLRLL